MFLHEVLPAIFFLVSCTSAYARDGGIKLSCRQFHTGKYYLDDSIAGRTIIERTEHTQVETSESRHVKAEFDINWVNDCTYVLKLRKVISDPDNVAKDWSGDLVLTCAISATSASEYVQTTTCNISSLMITHTIVRIK